MEYFIVYLNILIIDLQIDNRERNCGDADIRQKFFANAEIQVK